MRFDQLGLDVLAALERGKYVRAWRVCAADEIARIVKFWESFEAALAPPEDMAPLLAEGGLRAKVAGAGSLAVNHWESRVGAKGEKGGGKK